jgi:hypothetical protein
MKRVQQRTEDDCMIACLAMMLDKKYEEVKGWFTGERKWNNFIGLTFTLLEKKYDVSFTDESGIGRWGGFRRLVAIVPAAEPKSEGHVFVIDETEAVYDPSPNRPTPFDIPRLFGRLVGQKVECVVRIEKIEATRPAGGSG